MARHGRAMLGEARIIWARLGSAGRGMAGLGKAQRAEAVRGTAGQCEARQGMQQRTTILMRRKGGALWAAEPKAGEVLSKIPQGGTVAVRVLRNRSARQNAMYWRVLEGVIEATGRWRTPEELHTIIKIALGHVDIVQLLDGRRVLVPQSTSFQAMSQDEAQAYYDAAYRLLCTEVMGGCSIDELLDHVAVRAAA